MNVKNSAEEYRRRSLELARQAAELREMAEVLMRRATQLQQASAAAMQRAARLVTQPSGSPRSVDVRNRGRVAPH
jgi:hypothetical protein